MTIPPLQGPLLGRLRRLRPSRSPQALLALFALLAGCGAVAFAVAPMSQPTPLPPTRLVTEDLPVPLPAQAAELQAWRDDTLQLHRTERTRSADGVASVLRRLDVNDPAAIQALAADARLQLALGREGHLAQARVNGDGELLALTVRFPAVDAAQAHSHYQQLSAQREAGAWRVALELKPLQVHTRWAGGRVQTQLRAAAQDAQLPTAVLTQLLALCAEPLEADCPLARGDSFAVLYETLSAEGEPVPWNDGVGRVLAARFVARGVARQLTWFVGPDGQGGYFDVRGRGREAGFRSSPVEAARVTSGFATRIDPFRRQPTAHQGIDYAAPVGTPVRSVAGGVVEFAGRQAGYGQVVALRHGSDRSTLYAHLSRIDVAEGDRVVAGAVLGAVGATGWATGPHLHFEYRVAGVHQDPELAARSVEQRLLAPGARAQFERSTQAMRAVLDRAMALSTDRSSFE